MEELTVRCSVCDRTDLHIARDGNVSVHGHLVTGACAGSGKPRRPTKVYRLPKRFAEDHWGRDCGVTDVVVRETKEHFFVEMDRDGWGDMESDADYYVGMGSEMIESMGIGFVSSARATMNALRKAGPPDA